jgi:hypothetical protein
MPSALTMARRYAQALAALRAIHDFDAWLGEHWHERCPPPACPPSALTPLGADRSIAWHDVGEHVFGYLPGEDGCFQLRRDAPLPAFPLAGEDPAPLFGHDILISAMMQDESQAPS